MRKEEVVFLDQLFLFGFELRLLGLLFRWLFTLLLVKRTWFVVSRVQTGVRFNVEIALSHLMEALSKLLQTLFFLCTFIVVEFSRLLSEFVWLAIWILHSKNTAHLGLDMIILGVAWHSLSVWGDKRTAWYKRLVLVIIPWTSNSKLRSTECFVILLLEVLICSLLGCRCHSLWGVFLLIHLPVNGGPIRTGLAWVLKRVVIVDG